MEGWATKKLEEVAYLAGRIGWKGLTAKEYTEKGPLFLSVHSLNYGDYVDFRDVFHISQARYDESPEIMLEKDDILICKDGAGIGKLGIIGELPAPSTINSSLLLIRASDEVLPKYLYYKLSSPFLQDIVQGRIDGATTPHLYQREIKQFPIFVPPLPEQKRIVAILDDALERIGVAVANAEKNLANARELFESYLNAVFTQKGEGWEEKTIGDVCLLKSGTTVKKSLEWQSGDMPYVKVADMNLLQNEEKITTSSRFLQSRDVGKNAIFPIGSTIFPKRGGAIFTNKKRLTAVPICADLNVMCVTPSDALDPKFLYFYFLSVDMKKLGSGSSIPQINNYDIAPLPICFPSIEEQIGLSEELEELVANTKSLETIYRQKLEALAELKRSILQKAFSGELTRNSNEGAAA